MRICVGLSRTAVTFRFVLSHYRSPVMHLTQEQLASMALVVLACLVLRPWFWPRKPKATFSALLDALKKGDISVITDEAELRKCRIKPTPTCRLTSRHLSIFYWRSQAGTEVRESINYALIGHKGGYGVNYTDGEAVRWFWASSVPNILSIPIDDRILLSEILRQIRRHVKA